MNLEAFSDKVRRGLVPAALILLVLLALARATRPTAAGQVEAGEMGAPAETAPRLVGARPFFQVSVLPTPTWTHTPGPPTDTPTPALPTDTPTVALPTDTPTVALPTDTPTVALPTDTPTVALPTDTPTVVPPTDTPTIVPPTDTPTPTPVPIPPEIGELVASPPDAVVAIGEAVLFTAVFTESSPGTVTAEWFWGDDPLPTSLSGVSSPAEASHAYDEAGIYTVLLIITSESTGLSDSATYEFVVVYDPSGGFVTGGGWIDSPAGAYLPDPTLSGKANFGFVSKYTKGNQAPTGNAHFQFKVAGLNFNSSDYEWLVVAGSDKAIFKGSGTLNGQRAPNNELYNFKIWAGDGEPDTFRIRIWWEPAEDIEDPIYDSLDNLPIGGGSIVVHKGKKS